MHNAIAYSTEAIEVWFARGLTKGDRQLDEGEFLDVLETTEDELARPAAAARSPTRRPWSVCSGCRTGAPGAGPFGGMLRRDRLPIIAR